MHPLQFRLEQDRSSGRIHKRYADEAGVFRLTDERCQRDQSGTYVELAEAHDDTPADLFCQFDFPQYARAEGATES